MVALSTTEFIQHLESRGTTVVAHQNDADGNTVLSAWDSRTWRLLHRTNVLPHFQCRVRLFADGDLFDAAVARVAPSGALVVERFNLADGRSCGSLVLDDASDHRWVDGLLLSPSRLFLEQSKKEFDGFYVYRWRAFDCLLAREHCFEAAL